MGTATVKNLLLNEMICGDGGRVGKNPGFFKKPNPGGVFGFYWVLLVFLSFIGFF
jgi:hypothetical protein